MPIQAGETIDADEINALHADTGWTDITISAGFAAQGTDTPQVRKIGGIVYARGGWANTGMAINNTYSVGTLPAGFLPARNIVGRWGTATGATSGTLFITTAGVVQVRTGGALSTYYLFGGQSWPTD